MPALKSLGTTNSTRQLIHLLPIPRRLNDAQPTDIRIIGGHYGEKAWTTPLILLLGQLVAFDARKPRDSHRMNAKIAARRGRRRVEMKKGTLEG